MGISNAENIRVYGHLFSGGLGLKVNAKMTARPSTVISVVDQSRANRDNTTKDGFILTHHNENFRGEKWCARFISTWLVSFTCPEIPR